MFFRSKNNELSEVRRKFRLLYNCSKDVRLNVLLIVFKDQTTFFSKENLVFSS